MLVGKVAREERAGLVERRRDRFRGYLAVNAAGEAGGLVQLGRQAVLAVAGIVYPFVMTWIILWITDRTVGPAQVASL